MDGIRNFRNTSALLAYVEEVNAGYDASVDDGEDNIGPVIDRGKSNRCNHDDHAVI